MSEEKQEIQKFVRGENKKYSLKEKHELGQLIKKYKSEYDDYVTQNQNRINYNGKFKRHTEQLPKEGYMAKAEQEFYWLLKDVKHNDPDLSNALKLGKRCLDSLEANDFTEPPTKVMFRQAGGRRQEKVCTRSQRGYVCCFIDIRSSLKARLPKSMFTAQCKIFYEQWLSQQEKEVPKEKEIVFSNKVSWMDARIQRKSTQAKQKVSN